MICAQCFVNLTVANKFYMKVQESHEKLKKLEVEPMIINPLSMKSEDKDIQSTIQDDEILCDYDDMLTGEEEHYIVYEKDEYAEEKLLQESTVEIEKLKKSKTPEVNIISSSQKSDKNFDSEVVVDLKPDPMKKETKTKKGYSKDPHICEICGNSFNSKSILNLHRRRHQNIRPYKCE